MSKDCRLTPTLRAKGTTMFLVFPFSDFHASYLKPVSPNDCSALSMASSTVLTRCWCLEFLSEGIQFYHLLPTRHPEHRNWPNLKFVVEGSLYYVISGCKESLIRVSVILIWSSPRLRCAGRSPVGSSVTIFDHILMYYHGLFWQ